MSNAGKRKHDWSAIRAILCSNGNCITNICPRYVAQGDPHVSVCQLLVSNLDIVNHV